MNESSPDRSSDSRTPEEILAAAVKAQEELERAQNQQLDAILLEREKTIGRAKTTETQRQSAQEKLDRARTMIAEIEGRGGQVAPELRQAVSDLENATGNLDNLETVLDMQMNGMDSRSDVISRLQEEAGKEEQKRNQWQKEKEREEQERVKKEEEERRLVEEIIALKAEYDSLNEKIIQLDKEIAQNTGVEEASGEVNKIAEALRFKFIYFDSKIKALGFEYGKWAYLSQSEQLRAEREAAERGLEEVGFFDRAPKKFFRAVLDYMTPQIIKAVENREKKMTERVSLGERINEIYQRKETIRRNTFYNKPKNLPAEVQDWLSKMGL